MAIHPDWTVNAPQPMAPLPDRLCIRCQHRTRIWREGEGCPLYCTSPLAPRGVVDMAPVRCATLRANERACGPEGRWYSPAPMPLDQTPVFVVAPPTWRDRLRKARRFVLTRIVPDVVIAFVLLAVIGHFVFNRGH